MSEKSSEQTEMDELAFASQAMRTRIAPVGSAQLVETRIRMAAQRLRWKFSRARDVWYADPRVSLKARELRDIETTAGVEYGRAELRSVDALIARAETLAATETDEGVYSAFASAFRAFVGALDRTGTRGD